MRLAQHSPPPPTARRGRPLRHRLLGLLLATILAITGIGLTQVATAGPAQADVSYTQGGRGTVLVTPLGTSRATISMAECDEISLYTRNPDGTSGTRGSCVASLQHWLNIFSGANLAIDGQFGPATAQAVINYQVSQGLAPTGAVRFDERKALAASYNEHFDGPDFGGDHMVIQDFGGGTFSTYYDWKASEEYATWINNHTNVGLGVVGLAALSCEGLKDRRLMILCAGSMVIPSAVLADQAQTLLNDGHSCFVERQMAGFPGSYRMELTDNPIYCQMS